MSLLLEDFFRRAPETHNIVSNQIHDCAKQFIFSHFDIGDKTIVKARAEKSLPLASFRRAISRKFLMSVISEGILTERYFADGKKLRR